MECFSLVEKGLLMSVVPESGLRVSLPFNLILTAF